MARASRVRTINISTEFSLVTPHTRAFSIDAVTVTVAVGDFAFVVAQGALFAFPSRVTLTLPVDVFASLAAEDWANAWNKV